MTVSQGFLQDASWEAYSISQSEQNDSSATLEFLSSLRNGINQNSVEWTKLSAEDCIKTSTNSLQPTAANVALVTNQTSGRWSNVPASSFISFPPCHDLSFDFDSVSGVAQLIAINQSSTDPACTSQLKAGYNSTSLFVASDYPIWNISSFRGVFNSFDFRFWATLSANHFNMSQSRTLPADTWGPTSWLCEFNNTLSGEVCSVSAALQCTDQWTITCESFGIDYCISTRTD